MMRINCPYCGERDEVDFRCGGESHILRPEPGVDDVAWSDYLFNRDNPKGVVYERWCHIYGCGRWFNVARNSLTHEIYETYKIGDPKPIINSEEQT